MASYDDLLCYVYNDQGDYGFKKCNCHNKWREEYNEIIGIARSVGQPKPIEVILPKTTIEPNQIEDKKDPIEEDARHAALKKILKILQPKVTPANKKQYLYTQYPLYYWS